MTVKFLEIQAGLEHQTQSFQDWLFQIGEFRLAVWREETRVEEALFPEGRWIEEIDHKSRHFLVVNEQAELVAAARLSIHSKLQANPDGYLWIRAHRMLPEPVAHFCKLVVRKDFRGVGLGNELNQRRLQAAQAAGAKSIIVTASQRNTRILERMGFKDTGIREKFSNRPGYVFNGLEFLF